MATLHKYLFDLDFDAPELPPAPEPTDEVLEAVQEELPPPVTFSEEELTLARDQAYESGRAAGAKEAESETGRLLSLSLASIADSLAAMDRAQAMANQERLKDGLEVALTVVRKLVPEVARAHAADEIAAVVRECLGRIDAPVRVTIRVNPGLIEDIRTKAEQSAQDCAFEGRLVFTADPRIAAGDCRVEWGDGGAEREFARIWGEIEGLIARARGEDPAASPTEQHL